MKEPARKVCLAFRAFHGGFILLEFAMTNSNIVFKRFFRGAGSFVFRNFPRFFPFLKSENKE